MTQQIPLKQSVQILQSKIGICEEEIKYAKESVGSSEDFLTNYHRRLQEIDQLQGKYLREIETRSQAVAGIEAFLGNNQGSRTKMIKLMLVLRQATINVLNLLVRLRKVLGYPANFDLEVNPEASPLKQLTEEKWLTLEKLAKIVFTVNYFEGIPLQIVYNKLVKQPQLCRLERFLLSNENEDPFACSIFVYLQSQYNLRAGENYLMKEASFAEFETMAKTERTEAAAYFKQKQELRTKGYALVQVPTKFSVGRFEHYFLQKYRKESTKMLQSAAEKRQKTREAQMEAFRRSQIGAIDYVAAIVELQEALHLPGSESRYAQKAVLGSSNAESMYFNILQAVKHLQDAVNQCFQKKAQLSNLIISGQSGSLTDFSNYVESILELFGHFYRLWQLLHMKVNQFLKVEAVCPEILRDFDTVASTVSERSLNMQLSQNTLRVLKDNPENQVRFLFGEQLLTDQLSVQQDVQQFWKVLSQKCRIRRDSADLSAFKTIELVDEEKEDLEKTLQFFITCNEAGAEVCKVPVNPDAINVFNPVTLTEVIIGGGNAINYSGYDSSVYRSKKGDIYTSHTSQLQLSELTVDPYQTIAGSIQQQQRQQPMSSSFTVVQIPEIQQSSAIQMLGLDAQSSESDNFDINELVK